jgi:hypothetical protein
MYIQVPSIPVEILSFNNRLKFDELCGDDCVSTIDLGNVHEVPADIEHRLTLNLPSILVERLMFNNRLKFDELCGDDIIQTIDYV